MPRPDVLAFYTNQGGYLRAKQGISPIADILGRIARANQLQFQVYDKGSLQISAAKARHEYALGRFVEPWNKNVLVLRPAYLPRFQRIEKSSRRHAFEVAKRRFNPAGLDFDQARKFVSDTKRIRYGSDMPEPSDEGYIYVPLQGGLLDDLETRFCSPIDMLRATAQRAEGRDVVVSLHPNSNHNVVQLAALSALCRAHPNIRIEDGPATRWIPGCHYIVTQHSGAAFEGFFWGKPAMLFEKVDFHHICAKPHAVGLDGAFEQIAEMALDPPPFEQYLAWFLRDNCVNPENPQAIKRVLAILRRRGWELPHDPI